MKNIDHSIGQLEEFKKWAEDEFSEIRLYNKEILGKLESINQDRWVLYGKLTLLNGVVIILIESFIHKQF